MAKTTNAPAVSYRADNQYVVTRHDMATPYYSAYTAAKAEKATQKANRPANLQAIYGKSKAQAPKDIPTDHKPVRARRGFWCVLLAILLIVYIAIPVVNFFEVMPEFTSFLEYDTIEVDEEGNVVKGYIGTEDAVTGTIWLVEDLIGAEEEPEAEAAGEEGAEDNSEEGDAVASEQVSVYYDLVQLGIITETTSEIMALIFPIGVVLSLITALIFLIRALVAVFTVKRRKLFILSGILLFVFTLVGVVGAFLATGAEFSSIMNFIPMLAEEGAMMTYQLSLGYIIMAGVSLLALICSLFAFRSKKKVY